MNRFETGRMTRRALLSDLAANTGLINVIAHRSISSRFRQTFLGLGWTVLQPLAVLGVFTIFLGGLAGVDPVDGSYQAFALSSVVPWQFFSALVTEGGAGLVSEAGLVRRVALSRLALVIGKAGAALAPYVVGLSLMAVLGPLMGARFTVHLLWLPVVSVLVALPALALGVALAAVSVWVRDVHVALPFVMQALLFASPVAYPAVSLSSGWIRVYAALNPVVGPLEGMRRVYVLGQPPPVDLLVLSFASSLLLTLCALEIFRRLEPAIADVI